MVTRQRLSFRDGLFGYVVFLGLASFALIHTQGFQWLGFTSNAGFVGDSLGFTQHLPLPTQWTLSTTIGALTEIICAAIAWPILNRTGLSFTQRFSLAVVATAVFRGIFFAPYANVLSPLQWAGVAIFSTYYYWNYRRVWPLALSHALFNAIAFRPNDFLTGTFLGTLKTTANDVVLPVIVCWALAWIIVRTLNRTTSTPPKTVLPLKHKILVLVVVGVVAAAFIAEIPAIFYGRIFPIAISGVYDGIIKFSLPWITSMIVFGAMMIIVWHVLSNFPRAENSWRTTHSNAFIGIVFFAIFTAQNSAIAIYGPWGYAVGVDFRQSLGNTEGLDLVIPPPSIGTIFKMLIGGGFEELAYAIILLALICILRMPSRLSIAVVLIFRVILHLYYGTLAVALWQIPEGIFAGIYVIRCGRILPLIIAHGLYDAILALNDYLVRTGVFGHLRYDDIDRVWTPVTGLTGIVILTLAYAYYTHKRPVKTTESTTVTQI
ncbi:CPBP family glutamic-type intramembrane protease [Arcanobacterium phocae]|uniref:CPBP family glutamic-type intramembrane protease n=1 Tax=Arcanobacterium phocae TaxID=131112 RepID=UPI001C117FE0|nr:CPBP family glutamic-type intramembrane protease [Arcanobacterium phocae]